MDIEDLRRFAAVARRRSFAAAAAELGTDPSTLSRRIARLERDLGARLLHRTTRRMAPTEEGLRLLACAEEVLARIETTRAAIAGGDEAAGGVVRIAAAPAFADRVLIPLLPRLRRDLPGLSLELMLSDAPADLAAEGIDLAIRIGPRPEVPGAAPPLRLRRPLHRVVAHPAWAADWAAARPGAGPEALSGADCLVYALPGLRERWSFRRPGGPLRVSVGGRFACSSPLGLRRAALCGLGPALLADWLIAGDLAAGRLVDLFPGETGAPSRLDGGIWLLRAGPGAAPVPRRVQAAARALTGALAEDGGGEAPT